MKQSKPKSCRVCKVKFQPRNSMQVVCSPGCALVIAKQTQAKKERAKTKAAKAKLKTRSEWLKEAQTAFNGYIRIRDKGKPCISCDKPDNGQHQRHASHFRSVGAAPHLRFHLLNVHASCATCNGVLSGNLLEYAKRLPNKIGKDRADWLMYAEHGKRYSIEYAKRVKKIFNKRTRIYKKLFR